MIIDIVIASYNGSRYIKEQIESIINDPDFNYINNIIISDDGSQDDTEVQVRSFGNNKINFIKNQGNKGPAGNFVNALRQTNADYIFFCDQDDVWCNSRIVNFINAIPNINNDSPGVIYSDLLVVNSELEIIKRSFYSHESIPPQWPYKLSNLLLQNSTPGCVMLINKKAKDRLTDTFNENTIMHDWWVLLFASLHENVHFIDIATLMYRQHDDNSIGASKKIGVKAIINKAINGHVNIKKAFLQSNSFYNSLEKDELKLLTESQNYLFSFYRNYSQLSFYQRLKFCLKTAPLKSTLTKNIYTKAILLLGLK